MSRAAAVWILLATIWGSSWMFIKIGLEDLPPVTFAGLRFVVASVPLVAWLWIRRVPLPRTWRDWRLMIVTGWLTFSINYALVFWGEQHISSGLAAILYTTFPISGILFAHLMLPSEPLTTRKAAGVVLAVLGVALIFSNQVEVRGTLAVLGAGALIVAATGTALADVLIKRSGTHIHPVVMTAVQMVAGFVPMLAVGIPLEGNPLHYDWTSRAMGALLYLAFMASALTFTLLYWLIQRMEVSRTMLIPLFSTVVAVVLGIVVLDEEFTLRVLAGGAGILVGIFLATREPPAPLTPHDVVG